MGSWWQAGDMLRGLREQRGWTIPRFAEELKAKAKAKSIERAVPSRTSLIRMIREWEAGDHRPRAYADVFILIYANHDELAARAIAQGSELGQLMAAFEAMEIPVNRREFLLNSAAVAAGLTMEPAIPTCSQTHERLAWTLAHSGVETGDDTAVTSSRLSSGLDDILALVTARRLSPATITFSPPPVRELRTLESIAWVADSSHLSFQEAYDAVATCVKRLEAQAPAVRHARAYRRCQVAREQLTQALVAYYRDSSPGDAAAAFYRARVGGVPLVLSILVRSGWPDASIKLATDQERFQSAALAPAPLAGPLEGTALEAALLRLAEVEISDAVFVNNPIYRLLNIAIARHRLEATVALTDFASYALTMDLLEGEVIDAIAGTGSQQPDSPSSLRLPLRDAYLPTVTSALCIGERLCAGGPVALFAAARSGTQRSQGAPDYLLLIQERSARVLNVTGKLAVVPKAFHGPIIDTTKEVSLSASLQREFEEELLGREDLEHLSVSSYRRADPLHPSHFSEPMRWLLDRKNTDSYHVECIGFGINAVTGNYEFPCLIMIDDDEWWATAAR